MTKNQTHEWHENTEEGKRYIRGYWNSRDWNFGILEPGADDWTRVEKPGPELWLALRDVLWRKYQRKRLPWKFIERVDAVLEDMGVKPDASETED
jgi:hypothetical protein